jgi:hypothetical protein
VWLSNPREDEGLNDKRIEPCRVVKRVHLDGQLIAQTIIEPKARAILGETIILDHGATLINAAQRERDSSVLAIS